MREFVFPNGLKLIYEHRISRVTSFSIGFDAGANKEKYEETGLAHITEHMLFKGTKQRTEKEINILCDNYFGFNNAMTNFPYVIYYGTTLSEYFEKAFQIYSDIIISPTLSKAGFEEEIKVILEELNVWKDDSELFCEDELLKNAFKRRRLKTRIIGERENLINYTYNDVINFYKKYYNSDNCFISVVTSLEFTEVQEIIDKYFKNFNGKSFHSDSVLYEENIRGYFESFRNSLNVARIEYCYPIHNLKEDENIAAGLLNVLLGQGVSSLLYEELRTNKGLVYDAHSELKLEKGIKLFIIKAATSNENVSNVLESIDETINNIKKIILKDETLEKAKQIYILRREISFEKSIEVAKMLSINSIMYDEPCPHFQGKDGLNDINKSSIINLADKILINASKQVLKSRG